MEGVNELFEADWSGAQSEGQAIVLPNATNFVQFRLYTNASPNAPRLFNSIEIEAYGEVLLKSAGADQLIGRPAGAGRAPGAFR